MSAANARSTSNLLGYTLLIASVVHAATVFLVEFVPQSIPDKPRRSDNLQVVLVKPPEKPVATPADAQLLAQTNLEASGNDTPTEAANAAPPPLDPTPEIVPQPVVTAPTPAPSTPAPQVVAIAKQEAAPTVPKPPAVAKTTERPKPPAPKVTKRVSAAQLLASRNDEIARLTSELDRKTAAYSKRLRRKAVNASTAEYKYAAYLEAWRRKVESIGNLNYPDEARRQKLYGNLMLHVAVRADGSVERIRLLHSSGHRVLDDAAIRIVKLAAPFAPFPEDIRREVDVLDITRTWQFLSSNRLGWK